MPIVISMLRYENKIIWIYLKHLMKENNTQKIRKSKESKWPPFALIIFFSRTVTEPRQRLTFSSSEFDQALVRASFNLVKLLHKRAAAYTPERIQWEAIFRTHRVVYWSVQFFRFRASVVGRTKTWSCFSETLKRQQVSLIPR